jgi:peptidoglycan hydrolase-like protein with peptidoglycan-binding domain
MAQYKLLAEQQNMAFITLLQTLKEGSTGDQVMILQALLALDPSIYPEGRISGYFGRLTAQAVKRFQRKHGIEQLGSVGPKTLKKLNELLREQDNDDRHDEDNDRGKGQEKVIICHKPAENGGQTKTVSKSSLFAHLKHGDTRGACSAHGTDTTAPIISNITLSQVATTTATIGWMTNEHATGKVYYGVSTPVNFSTFVTLSTTTLSMGHWFTLTGLTASTTYYYALESKDTANNTATTSTAGFTTTN